MRKQKKGTSIRSWQQLYEGTIHNISYWSNYVSMKTSIEKEDAQQELILKLWEEFNKPGRKKKMTLYGMQKWIQWTTNRIIKNFYKVRQIKISASIEKMNEMGEYIPIEDRHNERITINQIMGSVKALLSSKENPLNVFNLILEGKTNKEISELLDISQKNVALIKIRNIRPILKQEAIKYGYCD